MLRLLEHRIYLTLLSGNATEGDYRSPTGYALTGLLYNTSGALSKIICNKIKVTKYAIQ